MAAPLSFFREMAGRGGFGRVRKNAIPKCADLYVWGLVRQVTSWTKI